MPTHRTLAGIAGLCAVALTATAVPATHAVAQQAGHTEPVELLAAAPATAQTRAKAADGSERARAVELDTAALRDSVVGDRITLSLFDDAVVSTVIEHRDTVGGITSWSGRLPGEDGTFSAVEVGGTTHINVASVEHGTYEVSSTKTGDYVVTEAGTPPGSEYDVLAPPAAEETHAHADERRSTQDSSRTLGPVSSRDAPGTIDVAIVYPAALVAQMGDAAMRAQFALGIAQTNEAFRNSGIATQVRLVGTRQVAATQSGDLATNLRSLGNPGDGVYDEAQALREETHADLVSLWLANSVPAGASCGIAYLGGLDAQVEAERDAWSVVYAANCATDFRVFPHELGHNFSANHDAGAAQPPSDGKPYARGYVDVAAKTITVMSYYDQCRSAGVTCERIGYYSSPSVVAGGRAQGTTATNNVQAINEQIAAVASYRQSQIYPGSVAIAGTARWGGTVTATAADWAPAVTFGYQWIIDGVAVPGLTSQSIKLGSADIGKSLSVHVTGSAPYYSPVAAGSAPVVIGKALFRTTRPQLRGTPRAGRVLSVRLKGWKPKPGKRGVKVRYQWMRNGTAIKGAKGRTYHVRAKDRGKKIQVKVRARARGYEAAKRTSKKVKIRR